MQKINAPHGAILIVGYGKIGKIKAALWHDLGYMPHIYDKSLQIRQSIGRDGYVPIENLASVPAEIVAVDISTPSGNHTDSLIKVLFALPTARPNVIMIEKPLVSSRKELDKLEATLADPQYAWLQERIFLNEQYYSSKTLNRLCELLGNQTILSVSIDLSKNRLYDKLVRKRFFDYELGAFGIELPHALAIVSMLGFDVEALEITGSRRYVAADEDANQAARVNARSDGAAIELVSYLGDFKIKQGIAVPQAEHSVTREINVTSEQYVYRVVLDPHPTMERFYGEITVTERASGRIERRELIYDNQLQEHIKAIMDDNGTRAAQQCSLRQATQHSDLLFKLSERASKVVIDGTASQINTIGA